MDEIIEIIRRDICVPIGTSRPSKIHKLFYSVEDNGYFVVICEEMSGKIITLLPQRFHTIFAVSSTAMHQARELAEEYYDNKDEIVYDFESNDVKISFFCHFIINETDKYKLVNFEIAISKDELDEYIEKLEHENDNIRNEFIKELISNISIERDLKHDTLVSVLYRISGASAFAECSLV